jgi:hypothetical protein
MATVAWAGKHEVEINITTAAKARAFNNATRRSGHSPNLRFSPQFNPAVAAADRSEDVIGTTYRTRLGEARKVR